MKTTRAILIGALSLAAIASSDAQKVKVGYDKTVDFSRFKTYSWSEPAMPPTYPVLYTTVVQSIDARLAQKGFQRVGKDGDLTIVPGGGIEYGNNVAAGTPMIGTYSGPPPAYNATMWTGAAGPSSLQGTMVPQGMLILEFVDRKSNTVIWTGSVVQKLDIEKKNKSLELAAKAVNKLLKDFPSKQ